ncbi:hypothetical protein TSUD_121470 [Trifolium subterraneum]|nr:hypothetical protein TSUD_121470 [Trifolium subterraneum]
MFPGYLVAVTSREHQKPLVIGAFSGAESYAIAEWRSSGSVRHDAISPQAAIPLSAIPVMQCILPTTLSMELEVEEQEFESCVEQIRKYTTI